MTLLAPDTTVITAGPRLDARRCPELREEADAVFAAGGLPVIDVRGVEHMDMAGLSALAWVFVQCRRRGENALLVGPLPEPVARLLDLTTFDRFFQVRPRP